MRSPFAHTGSLLIVSLLAACAAPSSSLSDVAVGDGDLRPNGCREKFETLWGADQLTVPSGSECGTPSGSAADQFPSNESGGKIDMCLDGCSSRQTSCITRCDERYPEVAPAPGTASGETSATMVKATVFGAKATAIVGTKPALGAGMQWEGPPAAPDPNDVARAQCIAECAVTYQACARACAVPH